VPPPIMVPDTLSNEPLLETLIIETPLPIETSSLDYYPVNIPKKLDKLSEADSSIVLKIWSFSSDFYAEFSPESLTAYYAELTFY